MLRVKSKVMCLSICGTMLEAKPMIMDHKTGRGYTVWHSSFTSMLKCELT